MKCKVCKRNCRDDGWCGNCQRKSGEGKKKTTFKYYNPNAVTNKMDSLMKQKKWLEHKLEMAENEEQKEKAQKKLDDWYSSNQKWLNRYIY